MIQQKLCTSGGDTAQNSSAKQGACILFAPPNENIIFLFSMKLTKLTIWAK